MKTYFNYQQNISSKDISEAISLPVGFGPICGFSTGSMSELSNSITISCGRSTTPSNADYIPSKYNLEYNNRWYNKKNVCIARDGTMYSIEGDIHIQISNTKGSKMEVMVFAYHLPIQEPVDNPVSLVAYWNTSTDISFFDIYKRTQDVYYPTEEAGRAYDISSNDPIDKVEYTYAWLDDQLCQACSEYKQAKDYLIPIGIYGNGVNLLNNRTENFAIVPYEGKFPMPITYNTAIHSSITKSLSNIEEKFRDMLDYDTVRAYIDSKIQSIVDSFNNIDTIPSGTIVLWSGDPQKIPAGWSIYTPAQGKVVVGWQSAGITIKGKTILQQNGSSTSDNSNIIPKAPLESNWEFSLDHNNTPLPDHQHRHWHVHNFMHRHLVTSNNGTHYGEGSSQYYAESDDWGSDSGRGRAVWTSNPDNQQGSYKFTGGPQDGNTNNPQDVNDTTGVNQQEIKERYITFSKLPPAVTLLYIIKD